MKIFRIILLLHIGLFCLNSCQSVKEGLTGQKSENSDEFLVDKKNPLILPPEFDKLPRPLESQKTKISTEQKEKETKKLLGLINKTNPLEKKTITSGSSLEKNILKKINVN